MIYEKIICYGPVTQKFQDWLWVIAENEDLDPSGSDPTIKEKV